jgi:ABC-type nickel/cobalt efflux system permease component RcnA
MNDTPKAGASTTILSFILGTALQLDKVTQDSITFWLQAIAFTISIVVGLLTIYISVKKLRRQKNEAQ